MHGQLMYRCKKKAKHKNVYVYKRNTLLSDILVETNYQIPFSAFNSHQFSIEFLIISADIIMNMNVV